MTGKQGWRTTGSGITHRRWECMSRKIRLDLVGGYLTYMGMSITQIRGLIVGDWQNITQLQDKFIILGNIRELMAQLFVLLLF